MFDAQSVKQKVRSWWADARSNPLFARALIGAGLIALIDQATKYWIVHIVKLPERLAPCAKSPMDTCRQIQVSPVFDLTYVENTGASFGMLAGGMGSRILLSTISIGIVMALTIWLARIKKRLTATAIAFIIGGAIGNLYDRIAYGYVVDFLDFSSVPFLNYNRIPDFPFIEIYLGGFIWVFNIADTAINIGVGLLLLEAFLDHRDAKKA